MYRFKTILFPIPPLELGGGGYTLKFSLHTPLMALSFIFPLFHFFPPNDIGWYLPFPRRGGKVFYSIYMYTPPSFHSPTILTYIQNMWTPCPILLKFSYCLVNWLRSQRQYAMSFMINIPCSRSDLFFLSFLFLCIQRLSLLLLGSIWMLRLFSCMRGLCNVYGTFIVYIGTCQTPLYWRKNSADSIFMGKLWKRVNVTENVIMRIIKRKTGNKKINMGKRIVNIGGRNSTGYHIVVSKE